MPPPLSRIGFGASLLNSQRMHKMPPHRLGRRHCKPSVASGPHSPWRWVGRPEKGLALSTPVRLAPTKWICAREAGRFAAAAPKKGRRCIPPPCPCRCPNVPPSGRRLPIAPLLRSPLGPKAGFRRLERLKAKGAALGRSEGCLLRFPGHVKGRGAMENSQKRFFAYSPACPRPVCHRFNMP